MRVQGIFSMQIQTCQKKSTRTCNCTKRGPREWPPQRFRHKLAKKTYFRSQIVHLWWPGSSETSIWNNPAVTMRLFTLIGVIIWNSQRTQTAKSCSRTNTLVQVEHTFTFCMTSTGMNRSNWNLDLKSFSYFSHYVSHSLEWSLGKLSACKLPQSSHSCISHTMFHTQTVTMLLFTIIQSDRLKHSTHTNCQQVALMHTLVPCCVCVCARHQKTYFFFAFH